MFEARSVLTDGRVSIEYTLGDHTGSTEPFDTLSDALYDFSVLCTVLRWRLPRKEITWTD